MSSAAALRCACSTLVSELRTEMPLWRLAFSTCDRTQRAEHGIAVANDNTTWQQICHEWPSGFLKMSIGSPLQPQVPPPLQPPGKKFLISVCQSMPRSTVAELCWAALGSVCPLSSAALSKKSSSCSELQLVHGIKRQAQENFMQVLKIETHRQLAPLYARQSSLGLALLPSHQTPAGLKLPPCRPRPGHARRAKSFPSQS